MGAGGNGDVMPLCQFFIALDSTLYNEVHGGGRPLEILNGRPPLVYGVLLGFDIILNINEQTDTAVTLLQLSGWE